MTSGGGTGNGNGPGQGPNDPVHLVRQDRIRIGPLTVDPPSRRIIHDDGREETLEPRAMQVLVALLRADGRILARENLIDCCWEGRIVGDEAISSVIYRLRRALKNVADGIFRIETIAKVGFRLVRDVGGVMHTESVRPPALARFGLFRRGGVRWAVGAAAVAGVALLVLVVESNLPQSPPVVAKAEPAPSLAVMPFADLSPRRDNAYFAEGMAEAIMGLLSEQPDMRVIGRTSIGLLGKDVTIEEARTRLGITHVLEGSVRRNGQALRVNVRLIDAGDGRQVWAEEFGRSLGDVFAIQDDIGAQVLSRLRGTLVARGKPPASFRTAPQVYDLYLAAMALERDETLPSLLRAKELLKSAIRLDPNYAPAHARLASYAREFWNLAGPQQGESEWPASLSHARRALALAPNLGDAHAAMGTLTEREDNWSPSLPHLQRAVELDPGNFLAWDTLAHVQDRHLCRYNDAAASYRRAIAIEPLRASPQYSLARLLAEMGNFPDAAASVRNFTKVSRDRTHLPKFSTMLSFYAGDLSSAAIAGREAIRLDPNDWSVKSGHMQTLRALGMIEDAIRLLPDLQRPIAAPLIKGDHRAAAAAAIATGDRIWAIRAGYLSLAMPALLRGGGEDWLVQSFDRNFASVEAFVEQLGCREAIFFGPHLIVALRHRDRDDDAARLFRLTSARFQLWSDAGHRGPMHEVLRARLLVLAGRREAALAALDRALKLGWLDQFWPYFGIGDPLFDPIREDPRFQGIERQIQAGVRRERTKLAA